MAGAITGWAVTATCPLVAQEGVAGAAPVYSTPTKKESPDNKKIQEALGKIRAQSFLVTTPVTVIDHGGEFVYDLQETDFEIRDNGAPQRLERFDVETEKLALVIIIQTNHLAGPLLEQVRPLASVFSSLVLGENGQAAVITFDDRIRVAQEFSFDGDLLATTLHDLKPGGDKARLNDALALAIEKLVKRPRDERRVVVAFSDGADAGSETQKDEVVHQATGGEVTLYGLGFNPAEELLVKKPESPPPSPLDTNVTRPLPPGTVPTPTRSTDIYGTPIPVVPIVVATGETIRSAIASSLLEFYAGYTGGVFYSHWSKKALEVQLSRIATEIHSQYELAYVPDTVGQSGFHRIEVYVRRPGVKVRTRAGYFYTATSP